MEYSSIPTPKSISNDLSSIHDNSNINISSSNDTPSHHNSINSSVNNTPLNKINTNYYISTKKNQDNDKAYVQYKKLDNLSIIDKRENINLISKQNRLTSLPYPLISPADKVSSTISKTTSINIDTLLKTIGFQNFPKVLKHYKLHPKITSTFKILDVI